MATFSAALSIRLSWAPSRPVEPTIKAGPPRAAQASARATEAVGVVKSITTSAAASAAAWSTSPSSAETPGLSGLLTLAVAVVVVAGLYLGRTVLIPITLAVLLSFVLAPIVNLLRRIPFSLL